VEDSRFHRLHTGSRTIWCDEYLHRAGVPKSLESCGGIIDARDLGSQIGDSQWPIRQQGDHLGKLVVVREGALNAQLLHQDRQRIETRTPAADYNDGTLGPCRGQRCESPLTRSDEGNAASNGAGVLSARERSIARLVAEGKSNRAVAASLSMSEKTVEAHLTTIFEKLGVRSRTELAGAAATLRLAK
jgi:DNA-binding CsgD family transcriptional regulator